MSDLRHTRFDEFIVLQRGFDLPRKEMTDGPYPVVGSTSIIGYHNRYKVNPPGVVTGRSGSLGFVQYICDKYWPHNTSLWVKDFKGNFPQYVYYHLLTLDLKRFNSGVGVPTLNRNDLDTLEIAIPPLSTQRKIAAILSAYDDLTENNLRRIRILEETAQLIYREWFVHFRFPGHEKVRMVDSELGRIPEGWEVRPLDSLLISHIGGGWGKDIEEERYTEAAWVIRGTDIPSARYCDFSKVPYRYHTASNLLSRRLKPGDIVFEVSGGSKGQPLGRALYVSAELLQAFRGDSVICASFCKRIQPDTEKYASEILYLSFLEAYESGEIEQFQVQSTGISNFKWSDYISQVNRCVPPITLQEHFCDLVAPLFLEISSLGHKNANLRQTHDLLLPKLISGELDVSELDIEIGEEPA
jgi:type I restriction enzyme S subunit